MQNSMSTWKFTQTWANLNRCHLKWNVHFKTFNLICYMPILRDALYRSHCDGGHFVFKNGRHALFRKPFIIFWLPVNEKHIQHPIWLEKDTLLIKSMLLTVILVKKRVCWVTSWKPPCCKNRSTNFKNNVKFRFSIKFHLCMRMHVLNAYFFVRDILSKKMTI